jgi:AcrR family transcriptional regulator
VATSRQWLDAGLKTLGEHGAPALTIERLAGEVGLSKGSFYHHFGGMAGYRTALLEHYEAVFTTQYIDAAEADPDAGPVAKLEALIARITADDDAGVEVALRAWALQDPEVRAAQERIDGLRFAYLRDRWLELTGDAEQAQLVGRLLYLVVIGAEQHLPPVWGDELRRICELTLGLLTPQPAPARGRPRRETGTARSPKPASRTR